MISRVGVLYHPRREDARHAAEQSLPVLARHGVRPTLLSAWEDEAVRKAMPEWQLCLVFGGDGTILRVSRIAAPFGVPQLGVNLGRLGFLSELQPHEVAERIPDYLDGRHAIEERTMLRATLYSEQLRADGPPPQFDALNEVLLARGALPRLVRVAISVDGAAVATFGGDGVLVATATGSTAYSLAAGGPVLAPNLRNMVLNTVCPHVARLSPLVLPPEAVVRLQVVGGLPAVLSMDGQIDVSVVSGDAVEIGVSPYVARFVRARPQAHFYEVIGRALR